MAEIFQLLRRDWPRYLLELIVIIFGISASFMLNQWRIDREDRRNEIRLLESLQANLVADTTFIGREMRFLTGGLTFYGKALASKDLSTLPQDSLGFFLTSIAAYSDFHYYDNAYHEMSSTGNSRLISSKDLRSKIFQLYNSHYQKLVEWRSIDKQFILERMIPYLEAHMPYTVDFVFIGSAPSLERMSQMLAEDVQFKNMLKTNRLFKFSILRLYKNTRKETDSLLVDIETELVKLRE